MREIDITTRSGWDIASAIRGPDLGRDGPIKEVLTMRIRALVVGGAPGTDSDPSPQLQGLAATGMMLRYGRISESLAAKYIHELESFKCGGPGTARGGAIHYLTHTMSAALALGDRSLARLAHLSRDALFGDAGNPLTVETVMELSGGE